MSFQRSSWRWVGMFSFHMQGACRPASIMRLVILWRWAVQLSRNGAHLASERGGVVRSRITSLVRRARELPPSAGEWSVQPAWARRVGRCVVFSLRRADFAASSTTSLRGWPACAFTQVTESVPWWARTRWRRCFRALCREEGGLRGGKATQGVSIHPSRSSSRRLPSSSLSDFGVCVYV